MLLQLPLKASSPQKMVLSFFFMLRIQQTANKLPSITAFDQLRVLFSLFPPLFKSSSDEMLFAYDLLLFFRCGREAQNHIRMQQEDTNGTGAQNQPALETVFDPELIGQSLLLTSKLYVAGTATKYKINKRQPRHKALNKSLRDAETASCHPPLHRASFGWMFSVRRW